MIPASPTVIGSVLRVWAKVRLTGSNSSPG